MIMKRGSAQMAARRYDEWRRPSGRYDDELEREEQSSYRRYWRLSERRQQQ
jgi:hypothetical protein